MTMQRNKGKRDSPRLTLTRVALGILALLLLGATPASTWIPTWISSWIVEPAHAQARVRSEFRQALSPYGEWRHSNRWGDVWTPRIHAGWRPYTVGRWIYTDDWGWYWVAGEPEAQWGWVVYHYGRWVLDPDLGWIWVADDTWGPSWVMWRQGTEQLGWAPMPPEPLLVDYRDESDVWIFVQPQEFFATDIASVLLPVDQIDVAFQNTVLVNQSLLVDGGFAVDPGIEPAIVAASVRHTFNTYQVRPQVLAGTTALPNAIQMGQQQFRQARQLQTQGIRVTQNQIKPAAQIAKPAPLAANERGRLGQHPPRLAQGARPGTNLPTQNVQQGTNVPNQSAQQAPLRQQQNQPAQTPRAQPGTNRAEQRQNATPPGLTPQQAQRNQQQQAQRAQQLQAQRAQQLQAQRAQQLQAQRAQQQQAQRAQQQRAQRAQQQQPQRAQQQAVQRAPRPTPGGATARPSGLQGLYGQARGPAPAAHAPSVAPHGPPAGQAPHGPAPGPRPSGGPGPGPRHPGQ